MEGIIKIRGLRKRFPVIKGYRDILLHPTRRRYVEALEGIDMEVNPQELFCILGPNGAGKTTLIKILATLILPDEGEVWVGGAEVRREPEKVKRLVGFALTTERSFYYRLTGLQNLRFFAYLNDIKESSLRIKNVLELTELTQVADRRFATYSAGMRQMLGIARALLADPPILFFDEPTKSLDPISASRIREILKRLVRREGKTILLATHNLEEAENLADRIAILDRGKRVALGTVSQLTHNHRFSLEQVYKSKVSA